MVFAGTREEGGNEHYHQPHQEFVFRQHRHLCSQQHHGQVLHERPHVTVAGDVPSKHLVAFRIYPFLSYMAKRLSQTIFLINYAELHNIMILATP